jgi:hypothetical protein
MSGFFRRIQKSPQIRIRKRQADEETYSSPKGVELDPISPIRRIKIVLVVVGFGEDQRVLGQICEGLLERDVPMRVKDEYSIIVYASSERLIGIDWYDLDSQPMPLSNAH